MLTPNYLMNVAEPLVELWSQLECDIIADIVRRLVKNAGEMTETARWQILKAREMGILQTDLAAEIAKTAKISKKQAKQLVIGQQVHPSSICWGMARRAYRERKVDDRREGF